MVIDVVDVVFWIANFRRNVVLWVLTPIGVRPTLLGNKHRQIYNLKPKGELI